MATMKWPSKSLELQKLWVYSKLLTMESLLIYFNPLKTLHMNSSACPFKGRLFILNQGVLLEYSRSSIIMVKKLLQVLLGNLGVEPDDSTVDVLTGKKMLSMILYPTCPDPDLTVGVGPHSDIGTLTLLSNGKYKSAEHGVRTSSTNSRVSLPIFTMPIETAKVAPLPHIVEKHGIALYREFVFVDYLNKVFGNALDGKKSLDFAKIN
ncbi:Detected protein of unknown function [Hibiscus syriacus]|uniref:Uncharacterized protein n=1 Tax=Hibiscus syriacus TaxID=106335 RepID=A0A6A3ARG7_HIBSY|nr:Detected protein of unknown function [Hibiscus syriacus]